MKFIGIVGSINKKSYNRKLLEFTKNHYSHICDIEIVEIDGIPLFNQDLDENDYPKLKELNDKIIAADGVVMVTPEHNFTVPSILKSFIEWMSYRLHPFTNKAVMILGASYTEQGSSRAQLHLRQILDSPGVDAIVMPGSEFLLANVRDKFDENDNITDERTVDYLEHCLLRFVRYCEIVKGLELDSVESTYTKKKREGGYVIIDDPYSDGTSGASEY